MASGPAGGTTASPTTTDASGPSGWDCFFHPIDCATAETHAAVAGATSGVTGAISATTAPLHEVSNTAMWTAIGIAAAAVAVIAIAIVAVYAFHRI